MEQDRGKTLVLVGDGLSSALDEWFDVGGTKDWASWMIAVVNPKEAKDVFVLEWRILKNNMIVTRELARDYMYNATTLAEVVHFKNLSHTELMDVALVNQVRSNTWVAELHRLFLELIEENNKLVDRDTHVDVLGVKNNQLEESVNQLKAVVHASEEARGRVSEEKVSEMEKLKKHVEQVVGRCVELEKQYQQMVAEKGELLERVTVLEQLKP
ncbi:hypothetical protein L1987_20886 [Smallanthus sonchifolius]|uniref:Uncharacterized protein n=1 Tax=Smallanthus sonchifolius TaxID=185202 RepID=A0ACB9IU22_9ASTR|nr:hypothetical protein L1987_20886 [Smallanthus sonchifolius]